MKWGRKKPPSSSSSSSSSRLASWISKFKKMGINSEEKPTKAKQKGTSPIHGICRDGRFYGGDDDAFWRLSFGEESFHGRKSSTSSSRNVVRSVWYDSDSGDEVEIRPSNCRSSEMAVMEESKKFSNMVSDIRKKKEFSGKVEDLPQHRRSSSMSSRNSNLKTIREDSILPALNLAGTDANSELSEVGMLKTLKVKVEAKDEKQRKSVYISRGELQRRKTKQISKVRVRSPRTPSKVEVCKIRALEDMKAKMKMKKTEEKIAKERTRLESFAVVKCSYNPDQDFRDSMVEMIMEKGIRRPDDLEELLACYLTLNSNEYHDLIIKVFRQVWYDLNQAFSNQELWNEHCCYES